MARHPNSVNALSQQKSIGIPTYRCIYGTLQFISGLYSLN